MNDIVCPYLYYQVQLIGWGDADAPFQRETATCFAQKHQPSCQYCGKPDACPILNKEDKKREQRT